MVASYTYAPNAEGFRWFYQQVWPAICRHDPQASVVLVGEGNEQLCHATAGDARIHWAGKVPDLSSYYRQAACVIVPIHSGGGTRLKLIEAMAWATPVVSTSLGAQGIEHHNSIAIADTPEQFADAVLQRLACPGAFSGDAQRARAVIAAEYTWDRVGAKLCAAVGE